MAACSLLSTSAPPANAFWGKGFRLLSYVQQAQTAKRFAKGRVCRLLRAAAAAALSPGCRLRSPAPPSSPGLPGAAQPARPAPPSAFSARPAPRPRPIPAFPRTVRGPRLSPHGLERGVRRARSAEGGPGIPPPSLHPSPAALRLQSPRLSVCLSYRPRSPSRGSAGPAARSRISKTGKSSDSP